MTPAASDPTILVIFGTTGDLMARKIAPSLYHLRAKGALPERFHVVGYSRRNWSDLDLREHVEMILAERASGADPGDVREFLGDFSYSSGEFDDAEGYVRLMRHLEAIDSKWGTCANKLFYLAVSPAHYSTIFKHLSQSGLTGTCGEGNGWTRVIVEKPFGHDARTSAELDEMLSALFKEEQIYRIDHYLAKEILQGILNFRFTNNLLETSWDRSAVESIELVLHEKLGVEHRGWFYDGVGALRDVGQNHLLQMLALMTMEQPAASSAEAIRAARATAIREVLKPMTAEEVVRNSYRSQYEGYRDIEGVDHCSQTETFFRLKTVLTGPRWAGVPVTFESGKRMGEARKEIIVTFRHPRPCLCEGGPHHKNQVVFSFEPSDSITIVFWAKKPGFERVIERREFNFFLYEKEEKAQYVEEYARLLLDAIRGDQTLFISTDEIRAMWEFIDPVTDAWTQGLTPLHTYAPDTFDVSEQAAEALAMAPSRGVVGICGLGKMGAALALNLRENDWEVVGYNRSPEKAYALEAHGVSPVVSLAELVGALPRPRVVWVMLTAGKPVDRILFGDAGDPSAIGLLDLLEEGDFVIDGGNSYYKDAIARAARFAERGIRFLDCGTSGGPGGARSGACLMVGGRKEDFEAVEPIFADVALAGGGYRFFEGHGAGHFVKMVHNGIEYGMMQAIAEGFQIMRFSDFELNLSQVAAVYQRGSVIESRLIGWLKDAMSELGDSLEGVSGMVGHTGEAEWTVRTAEEMGLEARVIKGALQFRVESERDPSYAGQVLSALRNRFGGHTM
ncbi:MAG: glucose-6-phosphate dehydrogenase [Actinobacteria bacterium]|nr:glucose-6-phosphate dehydrogenase [Actinomycetota bacterium]